VRRGKALASVVRLASVTDTSGNAVDLEELFAPRTQPEPEPEPETAKADS
jgi:trigger factor